MKIVHFLLGRCNPDTANGLEKTVYHLVKNQAELGHEVSLLSVTPKEEIPIKGVYVKHFSPSSIPFVLPKNLLRELLSLKPDVVHLHSSYVPMNYTLAKSLVKNKIPYTITPNGGLAQTILKRRWYLKRPYRAFCELPVLNKANFVHSVGDTENIKKYGVKSPVLTAPNGIDLEEIPGQLNPNYLVEKLPEIAGKKIILFLGRLDPVHKGLDLLLQAFAKAALENHVLVLAGPDFKGLKQEIIALTSQLKLDNQVFILDPIYGKEKFDLLASADVFVHTSRWEGLPFSVLEACAVGKPILVTPAANPFGKVKEYDAGILSEPDIEEITRALKELEKINDEELLEMGNNSREMIAKEFSWMTIAQKLDVFYNQYCLVI